MASTRRNHLAGETSPYLLQHADNPVDWHPWGAQALEYARREDKPILLSIGYSACHWCHVMAHESFEDDQTAAVMNRLFVNIKVDREERPDLDKIYQVAHQMLTGRGGGWPLTMFLTPDDHVPFFGGTYFPREPRYGMPSFVEVLEKVATAYRENRTTIDAQNREVLEVFGKLDRAADNAGQAPDGAPLDMSRHQLEHAFDEHHGGFSDAPKFPHPPNIERLLHRWAESAENGATPDEKARHMAVFSLRRMAEGGIYDQLGGGFCRYSVDGEWTIPHFEKMLYDNAQLLPLYVEAWQATGEALFRRIAVETGEWVAREMQSPEGGYYSTLDADSEGEEGRYYVWTREQLQSLLEDREYEVVARRFGVDGAPNFEGKWHLRVARDTAAIAQDLGLTTGEVEALLENARARLFDAREQRVRPDRDEKILTSWNAMMIRGMAIAARHLERPDFLESAERALDFLRENLWQGGRLLATCKDGRAHLNGYLDDYAFLLDATLELLQTRWRDADLRLAIALADALLEHFEDGETGGFFFTAHDHEALIHRSRQFSDDSLPSGNAIAARALGRLGHLLADTRLLDAAGRTLRAGWSQLSELPYAHNAMLEALYEELEPPQLVVVRGEGHMLDEWLRVCRSRYAPHRLIFAIPESAGDLPGALAERPAQDGPVAYLCSGTRCSAPIASAGELAAALR